MEVDDCAEVVSSRKRDNVELSSAVAVLNETEVEHANKKAKINR
jgi:hypothetical protein